MANASDVTDWLAEHPKMMGVLWTMTLLLAEAGTVAANSSARVGP